jgi:hypothetical protein
MIKNKMRKRGIGGFNISNSISYLLIAILSLALIGVGVYAYGGFVPATTGHSMGELMPSCTGMIKGTSGDPTSWNCISSPPICNGADQLLQWNGTSWVCYTMSLGYECSGAGWAPECPCKQVDSVTDVCGINLYGDNVYPTNTTQTYCSSGYIINTRVAYCCPQVGGLCQII